MYSLNICIKEEILQKVLEEVFEFSSEVCFEKTDDSLRLVFVFELIPRSLEGLYLSCCFKSALTCG